MKDHPILFSAPMVRALLDGSKTQTRRVVKPSPVTDIRFCGGAYIPTNKHGDIAVEAPHVSVACPYGNDGDQLWVRETFSKIIGQTAGWIETDYKATYTHGDRMGDSMGVKKKWTPSIYMPRDASRITLEIVSVRVERLQDISEADAEAEGCKADEPITWWQGYKDLGEPLGLLHTQTMGEEPPDWMIESHKMNPTPWLVHGAKTHYQTLWQQINGPGSWDANPWVWAIEFKKVTA